MLSLKKSSPVGPTTPWRKFHPQFTRNFTDISHLCGICHLGFVLFVVCFVGTVGLAAVAVKSNI